jgi:Leucine-rich repeat (LRR) protein
MGNLTSLKELNLWGNDLTTLPESMINISSLKILYVSGNPLDRSAKSVVK